jgi:nucleotide-binding universal stress UspA family protein
MVAAIHAEGGYMKILTIYDGTIQSKTALRYGIGKAREKGGELVVLHVFPSNLFIDYDAGPKAEEIARSEWSQHAREAERIIADEGRGVPVRLVAEEGDPEQEILRCAASEHPDLLLATPRYKAIAQSAADHVYIMPGTILVPVDNSDAVAAGVDIISEETKATGSKVMLLGIVSIHLYSEGEKKELEQVRNSTVAAMKKIKKALAGKGIEATEIVRSGYPDEEILKAAGEYAVSLIVLPGGGKTPSELSKATAILLDEPERVKQPVCLLQAAET